MRGFDNMPGPGHFNPKDELYKDKGPRFGTSKRLDLAASR